MSTSTATYPIERKPQLLAPSEPQAYQRDVPGAQVHIVDGGHYGGHYVLDTSADHIAALVDSFIQPKKKAAP